MARDNINDILVFIAVARERSFTRAAAKLGMSQSALSHIVRGLEERLGVRLLTRTTRSVSPTEAGERLLQNVGPRLEEIDAEITAITDLGDKPAGTVRITAIDHVIDTVLWPRIAPLLPQYPELHIEISSDYRLVDIAAERFDIGVRHGDQVEKDMIAVRLTADVPMRIVGAPAYFARQPAPASLQDLMTHNCINLRLASSGGLYAWELLHDGQPIEARVRGQAVFTNVHHMLAAALDGVGVTFLPESLVAPHVEAGRLVSVMEDWCPSFPGLHAYYPSRRHSSRALGLVIDALRYTG
ncbi:MAG: LysR family transcriptional regulator [Massilia sp.]|jgi:DNA-binding transcriptional LysR family regulator|uniref:DNA-binding transcriptional LysR family regulator n=1 Tax=Massilia aurea TaxID=373040 RepID=A0A7X0CE10_9BURK|nr:LysR family transcriptional regulator [Massilia aurea]MBB6133870.1 DNA-binding transcriptional LysR family regulator [Massilia aurea]MBD8544601.1 LysR family transcriptional regulator [Oxalobacteraceae sp. CFBP 8761]MBD8629449.1 LysR family transcriptional regulator [Oxalobacteraceae sp. CFBP 8753]MBD8634076.1 LysR family transcriptional regulator [Oxalobacteraceae sp. CFBP 8755]